jgi:hypothetical protein
MAVAGRDASVPAIAERVVGDSDRAADEADGADTALRLPGAPRRGARIYQEEARDVR